MDIRNFTIIAAILALPAACSSDRRETETPDQMTPASGYEPAPSTTNQPGQTGSPEPMNAPTQPMDEMAPSGSPVTPDPSGSPSGMQSDPQPAGGGTKGSGGMKGSGGSAGMGASGGSAGRR